MSDLDEHDSLHRLLGTWFTLLVFGDAVEADAVAHPLLKVVAVAAHCDAGGRAALVRQLGVDASSGEAWLIRPDQHIAWIGGSDHDPGPILDSAVRGFAR